MEKLVYNGETRPFIYIYNYGNVNLQDGDILKVCEKYVKIERLPDIRIYLSNVISFCKYDLVWDKLDFLKEILAGTKFSSLEVENKCIEQIVQKLPKKDFCMAKYQFSNDVRPMIEVSFINGLYKSRCFEYDNKSLAWYIYRNVFKILPDNITECGAELFEGLEYLHDYESF